MSVYKEGWYFIEKICNAQRQMFPDAADFGAPVQRGDQIWNAAKQLVDWYGVEGTRREDRYETGVTVTQDVELMYEGDYKRGRVEKFVVTFTSCQRSGWCKFDGYVTVEEVKSHG